MAELFDVEDVVDFVGMAFANYKMITLIESNKTLFVNKSSMECN